MSGYDNRMEESEQKLQARLEDFEAERRDAALAFKVLTNVCYRYILHRFIGRKISLMSSCVKLCVKQYINIFLSG